MTWKALLPYGIIAALVIALVLTCGDESPEPILSDETRAEIEREMGAAVRLAFKQHQDSLRERGQGLVDTAQLRERGARESHNRAATHAEDAEKARRALIDAKNGRDSLALVIVAYEERTREAEALSTAYDQLDTALTLERKARVLAEERATLAEERVAALEALNQRILDDVEQAEKGCRILGIVRCPTRKAAFIVGTIIGAGGALGATLAAK